MERDRDAQIIAKVRQGERESFGMLVRYYERPLYNFMVRHRLDRETASDLTQEAFLKAYRALPTFQAERSSFKTWMYTIAYNLIRDNARHLKVRARSTDELQRAQDIQPAPRGHAEAHALRDQIERLLGILDDESRSLMVLRYLQEVPYSDIAEVTGMPAATIRSKIHRALKKIQAHLAEAVPSEVTA